MSDRIDIESHGMQRMYRYYKSIQKSMIKVESKGKLLFETPVSAVLDAEDGMGQMVGHKAMEMAIDPAIFSDAQAIRDHLSQYLKELREAPKAEGRPVSTPTAKRKLRLKNA